MRKTKRAILVLIIIIIVSFGLNVYADNNELRNVTRVYFSSEITKGYGNGDCILLENYDSDGNKIYGLIDAGRKITKKDAEQNDSTVVKEFLKEHGVTKLDFMAITHNHGDHQGDAINVLDNYEVDKLYLNEFDKINVKDGQNQETYENIIERAIAKNIKVIGVSYDSLTSDVISPSRSQDFINNINNANQELFESFNETNTSFNFGSSIIQIFNWELYNSEGEQIHIAKNENNVSQYVTSNGNPTAREIVDGDNNNSIGLLLTQGNKKAFFAGDMNNLDKDDTTGRIGDEDRLKDKIGKVDFLKLGHHGYSNSNTNDYMNVLKPEYAVITNDMGGAYKDITEWLKENNTQYLYTTSDEYGISATITNNSIYFGFETLGGYKNVNGKVFYMPNNDEIKNSNYLENLYTIEYQERNVEANSWHQLKEIIESNKNEIVNLDSENKKCNLYKLTINLKTGGDWNADDSIKIEKQQNIVLESLENINILRGTELINKPLFESEGILTIGKESMQGSITLDGNKTNVDASSTLLKLNGGTLNLYNNVTLCNNMNKTKERVKSGTTKYYTSFGSAIYCENAIINMYGGNITNNSQDVELTHILPKETKNLFQYNSAGAGICMIHNSVLNMSGGTISNNESQNHSIVKTDENYTNAAMTRGIAQCCTGTGVAAFSASEVNLLGGEIKNNIANNNSSIVLSKATEEGKKTNVYSTNNGIYGVGVYVSSSKLKINAGFGILRNNANLNSSVKLEEDTSINSAATAAIRGGQIYTTNSDVSINEANIIGGESENNAEVINNGSIGASGTSGVSKIDLGGGIEIVNNSNFEIKNLNLSNCKSTRGGGIYITSAKGAISNSNISGNEAQAGGGIYIADNSSELELNNVKIINNRTQGASGGGIYAYGDLTISGDETLIGNNIADTYGGGIIIKNNGIINGGVISNNATNQNAGGGIRVDGQLLINGGTIKDNFAKTTGGGIDCTSGRVEIVAGTIENNTAEQDGNEMYPIENITIKTNPPTENKGISIEFVPISNSSSPKSVSYRINVYDLKSGIDENSLKYVWSNKSEVTKEEITEALSNGQIVESPKDATGKMYLYVYAKNLDGDEIIKKSEEIDFGEVKKDTGNNNGTNNNISNTNTTNTNTDKNTNTTNTNTDTNTNTNTNTANTSTDKNASTNTANMSTDKNTSTNTENMSTNTNKNSKTTINSNNISNDSDTGMINESNQDKETIIEKKETNNNLSNIGNLPYTGKSVMRIIILLFVFSSIISYIYYKKYKKI